MIVFAEHIRLVLRPFRSPELTPTLLLFELRKLREHLLALPPIIDRCNQFAKAGRRGKHLHAPDFCREFRPQYADELHHLIHPVFKRRARHKEQTLRAER